MLLLFTKFLTTIVVSACTMENYYFWNVIMEDVLEAEEDVNQLDEDRGSRFLYNLRLEAWRLSDKQFKKQYRVTKVLAREIIQLVRPHLAAEGRASDIPVEVKVLIALNFFSHGSYQEAVGKHICHTISQPSVSRCIRQVAVALNQAEILNRYVRFPQAVQELEGLRTRFYQAYNVPGVVGVVDGTHIAIVRPKENEEIYVNRKRYHSLNVQLVCDERLRIMSVNARFPGSCHDAHVWRQSQISTTMEGIYRNINQPFFLAGDSGYPLRPWLLTPLADVQPGAEARFQEAFLRMRCSVERCNGRLKNMWRCLLKHRVLHYKPVMAGLITNACCVLHNMAIDHNIEEPDINEVVEFDFGIYQPEYDDENNPNIVDGDLERATMLRDSIVNNHFA